MQHKKTLGRALSLAAVLVIFFFIAKSLYSNWTGISHHDWKFNYGLLIVSIFMFWLAYGLHALGWFLIFRKLGSNLAFMKALKIHLYSLFGKYVPGKAWLMVAKVHLCSKAGCSRQLAFASTVFENVFIVISGSLLMFLFILHSRTAEISQVLWPSVALMVVGLVCVHPAIFDRVVNWVATKLGKEPAKLSLSYGNILLFLAFYLIHWLLMGLSAYVFFSSIYPLPLNSIFGATGAFVTSALIGLCAIFAPGGLGVREGTMALLLSHYVPLPVAILLSLSSRICVTVCELSLAAGVTAAVR